MSEKMQEGEVFTGQAGILKDSNWLTAEAIPSDRDTVVQIECVVRRRLVKFKNEEKRGYGSLRFVNRDKELGLNATLLHVLCALFGSNCGDWRGKWVALYVDPEVSAFGKIVSAVRIRPRKVDPPAKSTTSTTREPGQD